MCAITDGAIAWSALFSRFTAVVAGGLSSLMYAITDGAIAWSALFSRFKAVVAGGLSSLMYFDTVTLIA